MRAERRKARVLATVGLTLAFLATGYGSIWGEWWWAKLFNLVLFGMTCGVSAVTWVSTIQSQRDEERLDERLRELERMRSGQ